MIFPAPTLLTLNTSKDEDYEEQAHGAIFAFQREDRRQAQDEDSKGSAA